MFLDDQKEASCPLQDRHLLLFGHSAPSLLTLYLKNKNKKASREGAKNSKIRVGLWNMVSFWFWQMII